jgi:hypothetical protein
LLGILELRRAEVHLLEGMLIRQLREDPPKSKGETEKTPEERDMGKTVKNLYERYSIELPLLPEHETRLVRLRIAKLDDAWCALECAERLISGRLRSSHWWSRLCVLKLRCLAEHSLEKKPEFRPLARRIQSEPLNQVYDLLHAGLAGCQEETRVSSRLRLVDLALRTAKDLTRDDLPLGEKALEKLRKTVDPILSTIEDCITSSEPNRGCLQIVEYGKVIRDFLNDWQVRLLKLKAEELYRTDRTDRADRTREALQVIEKAQAFAQRSGADSWSAELQWLSGVFLAAVGADKMQIEASFCRAIGIAKQQESVSLAKRAEATYAEYLRQKESAPAADGFRLPLC